jgi:hypothetical protein
LHITVPLAVEKVLYRLALTFGGLVPISHAFLELPLSLEEIEEYADQIADGHSVVKNEWGEYLTYEFPELMRQVVEIDLDDCPACGEDLPPPPTQAGVEVRRPVLCDSCFRTVKRLNAHSPDETVVSKLKGFFRGEEEENMLQVMKTEHEIFYLGLKLKLEQFTHTTLASQSRLPATQLKERLDRMAARRYIKVGLLPSQDAVGYSFPPGLVYPKVLYKRVGGSKSQTSARLALNVESEENHMRIPPPLAPPPPPPPPPPQVSIKKKLNIKIKRRGP